MLNTLRPAVVSLGALTLITGIAERRRRRL